MGVPADQLAPALDRLIPLVDKSAEQLSVFLTAMQPAADVLAAFIGPIRDLGGLLGGGSTGAQPEGSAGGSGSQTNNLHIDAINVAAIDTEQSTSQIAQKLRPAVHAAVTRQKADLAAAGSRSRVKRSL
jgi:hypothetical protein